MNTKPLVTIDPHYTISFYAELWGLSVSTLTRWFQDEPGVLKLSSDSPSRGRRTRRELRVPLSIALRIYQEHAQ